MTNKRPPCKNACAMCGTDGKYTCTADTPPACYEADTASERAILNVIWQRGKKMLVEGDGCQLCYGHYRPVAKQRSIDYRHEGACPWPAIDAMMKEVKNES